MPLHSEKPKPEWNYPVTPCDWMADRRTRWRLIIFIVVLVFGDALLTSGRDAGTVLLILGGTGLAGATIARWIVDEAPIPAITGLTGRGRA